MRMNELVSVIVPVYNVEKYLDQCISSLVKQTYRNIEIILVDDGSKDRSGQICDRWQREDARIRVIHQQNGGQSDARNRGIALAQGAYLSFVDSDDFVAEDYIETLLLTLKKNRVDIAAAAGKTIYKDLSVQNLCKSLNNKNTTIVYNSKEAIERMLYEKGLSASVWAKIYKKELFHGILFPVGKRYEDLYIMYALLYQCQRIAVSKDVVYYYRIRTDSIIGQLDPRKNKDLLIASQNILDFVKAKIPSIVRAGEYKVFFAAVELFVHYPSEDLLVTKDRQEMDELWNTIKMYRTQVLFDKNGKAKYRILAFVSYMGQKVLRHFYKAVAYR